MATDGYRKSIAVPFVFVPAIHFGKAAAAYCHHRLEATDLHGVFICEHMQVI